MKNSRTLRALTLGVVSLLASVCSQAANPEFTLKLHHLLPPMSEVHTDILLPWAQKIEQESGGRIHIDVFPALQLGGKPAQLFDQARTGVADITWTVAGYTPGRFPKADVFELPFMAASAEATSRAIQTYADKEMQGDFDNVKLLAIHTNGTGVFHSRDHAIRSIDDLKGLKVRAPNKSIAEALELMGASPTFIPAPQLPSALSKGVVDVAALSYDVVKPLKVHELVRSHTRFGGERGLYAQVFLFTMNKDSYERLPADLRAVIDHNSGVELAAWMGRELDKMEQTGMQIVASTHNETIVLGDAETRRCQALVQPVINSWIADMDAQKLDGSRLYQEANTLINQFSRGQTAATE